MTEENKEPKLLLRVEMWDLGPEEGIKATYMLPHIVSEEWVEFYKVFFENLCNEIAKVPGAELLYGLVGIGEEDGEGEDQS